MVVSSSSCSEKLTGSKRSECFCTITANDPDTSVCVVWKAQLEIENDTGHCGRSRQIELHGHVPPEFATVEGERRCSP